MIEVLWHGRGGQGAFTAAKLLGAAWSRSEGHHALAFPSFGPERRGAPMCAFTKLSTAPIGDRSALQRADYVVYLDGTLCSASALSEVKPGGMLLVNATTFAADIPESIRLLCIDADGISEGIASRAIPNTVMLGVLTSVCPGLSHEAVEGAIQDYMPSRFHEDNEAILDATLRLLRDGPCSWKEGR